MPIDRPNSLELLEAVREFLIEHIAPNVNGQLAFHARVASNALAIVTREIKQKTAMDEREKTRLSALLGHNKSLLELNRELALLIQSSKLDSDRAAVLDHLRQTNADKINLANPKYRD